MAAQRPHYRIAFRRDDAYKKPPAFNFEVVPKHREFYPLIWSKIMNRSSLLLAFVGASFFLLASAVVAQEPATDDYIELWKPLVGAWKTVSTADGKTVEGTSFFRIPRAQKCFVSHNNIGLGPASDSIHGYDPVAKQWKVTSLDAEGGHSVETITVKGMKRGKRLDKDYVATSEIVRHSTDGKTTTSSFTIKITACDKDRIEALVTDRKVDGKALPDSKGVMERQPRRERGAKQ
jgi:hypothetical protein